MVHDARMGVEDDDEMKRRRHSPEQIVRKLREADRMIGQGTSVAEVLPASGGDRGHVLPVAQPVRGDEPDEAKRLKELEVENARLKKLLAEAELDKAMLRRSPRTLL